MKQRYSWLIEPLPNDVMRALDLLERAPGVEHIAIMPDVHLASEVCIGTAVATTDTLYPAAVGGDIGCGMAARAFDASADLIADPGRAARVLHGLYERIPFLRHRRGEGVLPPSVEKGELSNPGLNGEKRRLAAMQLGTLGRGNHFLEFQADEQEQLWLMVHSGSRAMGQAVRKFHEASGERGAGGLNALAADSTEGRAYLHDLDWCLAYAEANRKRMVDEVTGLLESAFGVRPLPAQDIGCHHNMVRSESCGGRQLWVHRKGAISAREGELGIIPGSMGTTSFHVQGRGNEESLCSSSHGAGRRFSRGVARQRIPLRQFERELEGVFYDRRLAAKLREEAPAAYKDIGAVMRAQRKLTRIRRELRPLLSFKGA